MKVINSNGQIEQAGGGGGGGSINLSAGTTSNNMSAVTFGNGGGVSFGLNGSVVTAVAPAGAGLAAVYDGANSISSGTIRFTNANGISFTINGQTISGSVQTNYLTTAALSNHSHGVSFTSGSVGFQTLSFTNSNGISFNSGTQGIFASHNALTTARASTDGVGLATAQTNVTWTVNSAGLSLNAGGYAGTGFTSTTTAGTDVKGTHNTAGLSIAVPNFLTTAMASNAATISNIRVSAGTSSTNLSALTFDNAGGITFGMNGSVITAQAPAGAPSPVNFSAGTTSNNLASVIFANGNGVSFGLNTGASSQSITASHNGLTTARASNDAVGLATAQTNVTWTVNSAGLSFNAAGYAGTSTGFTGTNASASMTHDSNGLALMLSVPNAGGGAGYTAMSLQNRQLVASTTILAGGGQNSLWLAPIRIAVPLNASTILAAMVSYSGTITSAATAQAGHTVRVGIWSQHTDPASTSRFDTLWTGAASMTFWNSGTSSVSYAYSQSGGQTTSSSAGSNLMTASVMGVRHIILPIGSTFTAGLYVLGLLNSTSTAGYSAAMSRIAAYFDNPMSVGAGTFGQATNNSNGYADGGTYLTTTGGLPSSLALNQIGQVANVMPFFKMGAI